MARLGLDLGADLSGRHRSSRPQRCSSSQHTSPSSRSSSSSSPSTTFRRLNHHLRRHHQGDDRARRASSIPPPFSTPPARPTKFFDLRGKFSSSNPTCARQWNRSRSRRYASRGAWTRPPTLFRRRCLSDRRRHALGASSRSSSKDVRRSRCNRRLSSTFPRTGEQSCGSRRSKSGTDLKRSSWIRLPFRRVRAHVLSTRAKLTAS